MAIVKCFDCWKSVTYDTTDLVAIIPISKEERLYAYKHKIVSEHDTTPNIITSIWESSDSEFVSAAFAAVTDTGCILGLTKNQENSYSALLLDSNLKIQSVELLNTPYSINSSVTPTTIYIWYIDNLSTLHVHVFIFKSFDSNSLSNYLTHELTIPSVTKVSEALSMIMNFTLYYLVIEAVMNNEVYIGVWAPMFKESEDGSYVYDEEQSQVAIQPLSDQEWKQDDLKNILIPISSYGDLTGDYGRLELNIKTHQVTCSYLNDIGGTDLPLGSIDGNILNIVDSNIDIIGYIYDNKSHGDGMSGTYDVIGAFADRLNKKEYYALYSNNSSPLYATKSDGELIGDINFSVTSNTINVSIEDSHLKINSIDFGPVSEKYTHYTVNGMQYRFNQEYTINNIHDYPIVLQKAVAKPVKFFNSLGTFLGLAKTPFLDN